MKKDFIITGLFLLIILIGGLLYYTYGPGNLLRFPPIIATDKDDLYFRQDNSLYGLDVATQNPIPQKIIDVSSENGTIIDTAFDKDNQFLFFSVLNTQGKYEIWKAYYNQNTIEKTLNSTTSGLENCINFRKPQISPDNQKLAFITTCNNLDQIYKMDISNNSLLNLTSQILPGSIDQIDWSPNSQQIAFSGLNNGLYYIKTVDLNKKIENLFLGNGKISQLSFQKGQLLYLSNINNTDNIYSLELSKLQSTNITNLIYPYDINNFTVSKTNNFIVYEGKNSLSLTTDLYRIDIDGTNLFQITTTGDATKPIISPDNNKVSYLINGNTIVIENLNRGSIRNLYTSQNIIYKIINWR